MFSFRVLELAASMNPFNLNGILGNSLGVHSGFGFSTYDHDVDENEGGNCARHVKAAWWYRHCFKSNLNGLYLSGNHSTNQYSLSWHTWKGHYYSLKRSELKIR